jgi:hypothetical protein
MAIETEVGGSNFQNQSAGDISSSFSSSEQESFSGQGSSIRNSDLVESLRDVFRSAKEEFQSGRESLRESLGDREEFNQIVESARQSFESAREGFEQIRQTAQSQFSDDQFLSQDALSDFVSQAENLFQRATDQFNRDDSNNSPSQPEQSAPEVEEPPTFAFNETDPNQLNTLDPARIEEETNLADRLGDRGDVLDGGGGTNTVIGAGGNDIILGNTPEAFNTITTGTGEDLIVLGKDTTNRVFDFDPVNDKFGIDGFSINDVVIGQGTNPDNGGLDQPLDSDNNTVIVDRATNNILASLTFVSAGDLSEKNFVTVRAEDLQALVS